MTEILKQTERKIDAEAVIGNPNSISGITQRIDHTLSNLTSESNVEGDYSREQINQISEAKSALALYCYNFLLRVSNEELLCKSEKLQDTINLIAFGNEERVENTNGTVLDILNAFFLPSEYLPFYENALLEAELTQSE